jgi:hypothetical protein
MLPLLAKGRCQPNAPDHCLVAIASAAANDFGQVVSYDASSDASGILRLKSLVASRRSSNRSLFVFAGNLGNDRMVMLPSEPERLSSFPLRLAAGLLMIWLPRPIRYSFAAFPLSATQQMIEGPDSDSSARILPLRSTNAWRAAFSTSSDTIMPSRQHRAASISTGFSTSTSSIPPFQFGPAD